MTQNSLLFVPGDRPDRFEKAAHSGAHAIVIDLEDAVHPDRKGAARQAATQWLAMGNPAIVRINAAGTPWHEEDLALIGLPALQALMLPKAEGAQSFALIEQTPCRSVIALVETAFGVWNILETASRVEVHRLAFGSIDFGLDTGAIDGSETLSYARSRLVLASAIAGLPGPIDGVSVALDDVTALARDVLAAKGAGFAGKLCIHPKQVAPVNQGFAPDVTELAWARRVVELVEHVTDSGALQLDGKMIDRPVIERARRLIETEGMRR
jgi:citrate lyase subunit beta/citryl-CoA lyase